MLGLGLGLNINKQLQGFENLVKSAGGVLYYDARKDLIQANGVTPDRSGAKTQYNYTNELNYNTNTWAEWTKTAGVTGDSTGLSFDITQISGANLPSTMKSNTKYGILMNIVSNTLVTNSLYFKNYGGTNATSPFVNTNGEVGNKKHIFTTDAVLSDVRITIGKNNAGTGIAKILDFRIFELPTGSSIEADFTGLTADQLNAKYPMSFGQQTASRGNDVTWANYAGTATSGIVIENGKVFRMLDGADDFGSMVNTASIDITSAPLGQFFTIRISGDAAAGTWLFNKGLNSAATTQYGMALYTLNTVGANLEGTQRGALSITLGIFLSIGYIWDGVNIKYYLNVNYGGVTIPCASTLTSRPNARIGTREAGAAYIKCDLATSTIYTGAKATEANILKAEKALSKAYI
jgi:hypothetical protein